MSADLITLLLLFLALLAGTYLLFHRKVYCWIRLITLSFLLGGIMLYIRESFGRYFTTIDESYYVSLLGDSIWYKNSIVSGYITPFLLHVSRPFFPTPVNEVIWYSIIMGVVYPVVVFLIYRKAGFSTRHSAFSVLASFMTPLYLWSVLQVRPQQLGLLIGLVITVLVIYGRLSKTLFLSVSMLYILLIFSHVLSFIMYSVLMIAYISLKSLLWEKEEVLKKYYLVTIPILLSWLIFLVFPYSRPILSNMVWLFNSVFHMKVSTKEFSILSLGITTILLVTWHHVLKVNLGRLRPLLMVGYWALKRGQTTPDRQRYRLAEIAALFILLIIAYLQFHLGSSVYTMIYRGSLVALILFQLGNLMFGITYLRGLVLRGRNLEDFEILSILVLPIAGIFLGLSFFMPRGNGIWGFHNWLIRALQYFVPLGAPVVAYSLLHDSDSVHAKWKKAIISLSVALIIMISVLNTARTPIAYSYDAVWTPELVTLCENTHGSYIWRGETSLYSMFVTSNLLKACGSNLILKRNKMGYTLMSSDSFYVYSFEYRALTFAEFGNLSARNPGSLSILFGGNLLSASYAMSLIGNSQLILLKREGLCPLGNYLIGRSVLLIGGSFANPCTKMLEAIGAVKVRISPFSVTTPRSSYSIRAPDTWWDNTEGIFVIQSLSYMSIPIILIEGTNLDATLAGMYYFARRVYPKLEEYSNIHYIVGEWEETDGKVLMIAKGVPEDSNGFSPGDRITIIEMG